MLNNKEMNQAEELSECLDHVNDGRRPITQDEEIKELVEMATLVKHSYSQGDIPQLLIGELVNNLEAELKAQRKRQRRTHWWYGGLIGTAAAVLIAAFVQFLLPQSADHNIAQRVDDNREIQENVAVADQGSAPMIAQATNAMIEQQVQSVSNTQAPAAVSVGTKVTDDLPKVIAEIVQVAESPEIDQNSNQVAILQQERPKDMTRMKSALMAKADSNALREDKDNQLERRMAIMVLPNQTTQSITVDHTSGVIRQVYNQGTDDEVIITQRLLDESMIQTKGDTKQSEMQARTERAVIQRINKDTMNSLTVKIDKYDITIEGKKTKEDLQKIADSLTRMD